MTSPTPTEALDLTFLHHDTGDTITIREYFKLLLETLWSEGEGFSGKRPFGNSGWEHDLAPPLIKAGCVKGKINTYDEEDEEPYEEVDTVDNKAYDEFVFKMIEAL